MQYKITLTTSIRPDKFQLLEQDCFPSEWEAVNIAAKMIAKCGTLGREIATTLLECVDTESCFETEINNGYALHVNVYDADTGRRHKATVSVEQIS